MCRLEIKILIISTLIFGVSMFPSPPKIGTQPPNDEMNYLLEVQSVAKPLKIECKAEGEPAPKYRWIKDGVDFDWHVFVDRMKQQPGQGTLIINQPLEKDSGQYQCFAENEHGVASSNSVHVRISSMKSPQKPKIVTAVEGSAVILECESPDDWQKPIVSWVKLRKTQQAIGFITSNNSTILNDNNYDYRVTLEQKVHLHISRVTKADASNDFYYACVITSMLSENSNIVNRVDLKISSEEHFQTRQRTSLAVNLGEEVRLFCGFDAIYPEVITWKKDEIPIAHDERSQLLDDGRAIKIHCPLAEDSGVYTCDNTNNTHSIHLTVNIPPHFLIKPSDQNIPFGENAEFHCVGSGKPSVKTEWTYNGIPIDSAPSNSQRTVTPNSIFLQNVAMKDVGNYGCNVSNSLSYAYSEAILNVINYPPEFTEISQQEVTFEGVKNFSLRCRAFGSPIPQITWTYRGKALNERFQIQPNGDLKISNILLIDSGQYQCNAQNQWGSIETSVLLLVKKHTTVMLTPVESEIAALEVAKINCNVITDSTFTADVKWLKGTTEIDFGNNDRFMKTKENALVLLNATETDSGYYNCKATTELDVASNKTLIKVRRNDPNEFHIQVSCFKRTAEVKIKRTSLNPNFVYTLQYSSKFIDPDNWTTIVEHSKDGIISAPVVPWMEYIFKVTSNIYGSTATKLNRCLAMADFPDKNPSGVTGEGTTPTNLVISWTPMPREERHGPDFYYKVAWTRDHPGMKWNYKNVSADERFIVVSNQPTFVRYRMKVTAANVKGDSLAKAAEVIGYSGEDRPTQAPTNFTLIKVIDGSSAIVQWDPIHDKHMINGHFRAFKIQTWNYVDKRIQEYLVYNNATRFKIQDLRENTISYAHIMVVNNAYEGPASATIEILPKVVGASTDYAVVVCAAFAALLMLVCLLVLYWRHRRCRSIDFPLPDSVPENINILNFNILFNQQANLLPYDEKFEFPQERLKLEGQIGFGDFSTVVKATAEGIVENENRTTVAVKITKYTDDIEMFRPVMAELKTLIHVGRHLNVVHLMGAVTTNAIKREIMIILEYCPFGNVLDFLINHRSYFVDQIIQNEDRIDPQILSNGDAPESENSFGSNVSQCSMVACMPLRSITTTDLLCWSYQIANGMEYVASRNVIHSDLTARNILLCNDNIVKISGFQLAQAMPDKENRREDLNQSGNFPLKWMAMECLSDLTFSTYSDVWSFGVFLWELFSLGLEPYPAIDTSHELYEQLKNGYRLEQPPFATQDIYEIMLSCWQENPEGRLIFDQLAERFSREMPVEMLQSMNALYDE